MKICIVAAGLATRLQPLTNYIPKFLINTGKQTGFVEMIRYWSVHSKDFTIVLHPKFVELTQAYFDLYFKDTDIKLTIKPCETALGTAHTIDTALGNEYDGHDVLFTWCDVIPSKQFDSAELDNAVAHGDGIAVFTVDNGLNRYKYQRNTLVKADDGDVIGIYYVERYDALMMDYVEGQDFADVLAKNFINQFPIEDIIDFGDKPKLFEVLKNADEGREFNSVEIGEKFVHKKALNQQGVDLIEREIRWYSVIMSNFINVKVPKIYPSLHGCEFLMERVDGVSVYKIFQELSLRDQMTVLLNIGMNLERLHEKTYEVENEIVMRDVQKEAFDKLIARYDEISRVIQAFGKNINVVNGVKIDGNPKAIIAKLFDALSEHYKNTNSYSIIHGDLQMSNSMVNPETLEVTFIDPRGYFGNSLIHGLPDYDYAKVLYSLSGYDLFNYSTSFHISNINDTEIDFEIPQPVTSIPPSMFKPVHYLWLAVIWIGLAQYIKNNPIKSVAAHYHGLALATRFLNNDYTL
jgi:hypothetical protein